MHIAILQKRGAHKWEVVRYRGHYRVILRGSYTDFEHDIRESLDNGYGIKWTHSKRGWSSYRQNQLNKLKKDVEKYDYSIE